MKSIGLRKIRINVLILLEMKSLHSQSKMFYRWYITNDFGHLYLLIRVVRLISDCAAFFPHFLLQLDSVQQSGQLMHNLLFIGWFNSNNFCQHSLLSVSVKIDGANILKCSISQYSMHPVVMRSLTRIFGFFLIFRK